MKTKEKCILCGKDTPYNVSDDISIRKYYIEGDGQLCEECYNELYNKTKN